MSPRRLERVALHIPALDCPNEFRLIEQGLGRLDGVTSLAPDYLRRNLRIEFESGRLHVDEVLERLRRIGFSAQLLLEHAPPRSRPRLRWATLAGGLLLAAAFAAWLTGFPDTLFVVLALASMACSGWPVFAAALRAAWLRRIDMNVLMALAAVGAVAIGELGEGATALWLFGVALWLESFSVDRARRAVESLARLTPHVAHRLRRASQLVTARGGAAARPPRELRITSVRRVHQPEEVPPEQIARGDLLLLRPGERAPVDGVVRRGRSTMNQAPITGESVPVDKAPGDRVFAGSLNGEGALEMIAATGAADSTLAQIARLVDAAQATRSPTQRFVDRFAAWYTPAVVAIAVLVAVGPTLATLAVGGSVDSAALLESLRRGLVLLVIACPCALVISTPVTIVCGLQRAARQGLLIKGGEHLESAGRIDALAFDKTGTLTAGHPRLVDILPADGVAADDALRTAAALEAASLHPLAIAVLDAARERRLRWPAAMHVRATPGEGVEGELDGRGYRLVSPRHVASDRAAAGLELATQRGATCTLLVDDAQRVLAALLFDDPLRDDAAAAIAELRRQGVRSMVMLTGDHRAVAERIGSQLGLDAVHADLLPAAKIDQVRRLAAEYPWLAMVGDGVNDAPALAAARLGVAFGSAASDTALETADVVIVSPRLRQLARLLALGRRTRSLLAQNIGLSLAIKLAALAAAAAGWATMWMAVAADVGATMLVVFNGMRLLAEWDDTRGR